MPDISYATDFLSMFYAYKMCIKIRTKTRCYTGLILRVPCVVWKSTYKTNFTCTGIYTQQMHKSPSCMFRHSLMMASKECRNVQEEILYICCVYIPVHVKLVLYTALLCFGNTYHDQQRMYSHSLVPDATRWRVCVIPEMYFVSIPVMYADFLYTFSSNTTLPPPPQDSQPVILDRRSSRPIVSRNNAIAEEFVQNLHC